MKIIFSTGGSGGHLFPAIKAAPEIINKGHQAIFLGSFNSQIRFLESSGFEFKELKTKGLSSNNLFKAFNPIILMIKAIFASFKILKDLRPDAVVGFGGYGSFAAVLSAKLLKIPILIHEQNVIPGRANKLLAKIADIVMISFFETKEYFNDKKIVQTGCPTNAMPKDLNRKELLKKYKLFEGVFTILIFGGSKGSRKINESFLEVLIPLKDKINFQVIHICGKYGYDRIYEAYEGIGINFALFEFLDSMSEAYFLSDIVISRSGASTICEIASFKRFAILIPYPHKDGHQKRNAKLLSDKGAGVIIEENILTPQILSKNILGQIKRKKHSSDYPYLEGSIYFPEASKKIAYEVIKLKK